MSPSGSSVWLSGWFSNGESGGETVTDAAGLMQAIKDAVRVHHEDEDKDHDQGPPGSGQWYVDELCIDCDAVEFWRVVERALDRALSDEHCDCDCHDTF